jgi:tetratricopeptide (TPR) repeat protein
MFSRWAVALTIGVTVAAAVAKGIAAESRPAIAGERPEMSLADAPHLVPGQLSTLFKINDADPESQVPTRQQRIGNPVEFGYYLQDLLARAESTTKKDDHQRAIKYYRALASALPEQAQGWSLLCGAYERAHDRERALRACKYAIDREGADLKDYHRYVDLLLAKPGELDGDERGEVDAVLANLDKQSDLAIPTAHLRCQAATKMKDSGALQACTAVLAKAAPDDPKTVVFQWTLAVMRGDGAEAARLVRRAQALGVASESIARMSGVAPSRWSSWPTRAVLLTVVALIVVAVAFYSRRRLPAAVRRVV